MARAGTSKAFPDYVPEARAADTYTSSRYLKGQMFWWYIATSLRRQRTMSPSRTQSTCSTKLLEGRARPGGHKRGDEANRARLGSVARPEAM